MTSRWRYFRDIIDPMNDPNCESDRTILKTPKYFLSIKCTTKLANQYLKGKWFINMTHTVLYLRLNSSILMHSDRWCCTATFSLAWTTATLTSATLKPIICSNNNQFSTFEQNNAIYVWYNWRTNDCWECSTTGKDLYQFCGILWSSSFWNL